MRMRIQNKNLADRSARRSRRMEPCVERTACGWRKDKPPSPSQCLAKPDDTLYEFPFGPTRWLTLRREERFQQTGKGGKVACLNEDLPWPVEFSYHTLAAHKASEVAAGRGLSECV